MILPRLNNHFLLPTVLTFIPADQIDVLGLVNRGCRVVIEESSSERFVWAEVTLGSTPGKVA